MTRTQLACFFLIASAFVLAAMLATKLTAYEPTARAGMVLPGSEYVFMTARTETGEDSLFVIDKRNHLLLVYNTRIRTRGGLLEAKQYFRLDNLLNVGGGTGTGDGPGTTVRDDPRVPR